MTYSSSLAANRQKFAGRNQNTTSFRSAERAIGPVSNTIILIILACVLGLLYLTQVTKTNSYGYKISELSTQASTLQQERSELEVSAARLQALDRVKNSDATKNLVSVAPSSTLTN
jgi:outer membrane murein-binding lipoprotein Lpp